MCKGGRTRADKIGVGAGGDIVVATSTTQVWCTHTHRQNRYRRLLSGQFCEWCRTVNMALMWNRRFDLLCLLHLRRRRRLKQREREFWEHPIVAARTLEGACYTLYGRLREDEKKFCNYFIMSTSTFDYIVDRSAPHLERQNSWCGKAFVHGKCLQ